MTGEYGQRAPNPARCTAAPGNTQTTDKPQKQEIRAGQGHTFPSGVVVNTGEKTQQTPTIPSPLTVRAPLCAETPRSWPPTRDSGPR